MKIWAVIFYVSFFCFSKNALAYQSNGVASIFIENMQAIFHSDTDRDDFQRRVLSILNDPSLSNFDKAAIVYNFSESNRSYINNEGLYRSFLQSLDAFKKSIEENRSTSPNSNRFRVDASMLVDGRGDVFGANLLTFSNLRNDLNASELMFERTAFGLQPSQQCDSRARFNGRFYARIIEKDLKSKEMIRTLLDSNIGVIVFLNNRIVVGNDERKNLESIRYYYGCDSVRMESGVTFPGYGFQSTSGYLYRKTSSLIEGVNIVKQRRSIFDEILD